MTEFLTYLCKVAIVQAIFFIFYMAALRHLKFFYLNRIVLGTVLLAALLLPFVQFFHFETAKEIKEVVPFSLDPDFLPLTTQRSAEILRPVSWGHHFQLFFMSTYVCVFFCLVIRFVFRISALQNLRKNAKVIRERSSDFLVVEGKSSFSFFNLIFISKRDWDSEIKNTIINHELAHKNLGHSYDLLFHEIACIFLWFSPFVHLQKIVLKEVHEFQADRSSLIKSNSVEEYLQHIYFYLNRSQLSFPVNYFNQSSIKRRIHMLTSKPTSSSSKLRYALMLPIIVLVFMSMSGNSATQDIIPSQNFLAPGNFAQHNFVSDIPDSYPVKEPIKITSGFGMRMHPIKKEKMLHKGIDFAAPTGTPVFATASGTIVKANFEGNYGNLIIIQHAEGYTTYYGQLNEMQIREGEFVQKGQQIGTVGSTGMSTAPHLHYEVRRNDEAINPEELLDC